MSHPSRSPFSRLPGATAGALAADLKPRLDIDDEDFSIINPSVVSSLAQLSARGSASARRGESSASFHTPRVPGGGTSGNTAGPSSAPTKLGSSKLLKAVFIGPTELESLCLGYVGNKARFCIARKIRGGPDCGVSSHKTPKMSVPVDTFWMPGGSILNKPTAKTELCIPRAGLSTAALTKLTDEVHTEPRWADQFKAIAELTKEIERRRSGASMQRSSISRSSEVESVYSENDQPLTSKADGSESDNEDIPVEVAIDPLAGWEAACNVLQEAVNQMSITIASQAKLITQLQKADVREDVEAMQENSAVFQSQVRDLYDLVVSHGSLSNAMAEVMGSASRSAADLAVLTSEMEALEQAMNDFSSHYDIPQSDLVRLINKLSEKVTWQTGSALELSPTAPEAARVASPAAGGSHSFDLDTILGTSHLGGTPIDVSMNYVMSKMHTLSNSMGSLESRMHSTGISFDGVTFPSDEEFASWFMSHNPRGLGMSAFVDIILVWSFLNAPQTSAEWLSMLEKSAKLGFGPLDTAYIHSMTYKYPPKFAGKSSVILSTEHIKMLKSMDDWRGTSDGMSMGDGVRDQLLSDIRSAVANHAQYCRDHLPEGKFRAMAIQTGNETLAFFIAMVGYIEAEITTLGNLNIQPSHILLLLSNQVVRMCDDIHEIRTHGSRTLLDNHPLAAARFACVTLRALGCMSAFAKARFKDHPAINSAYMRCLTCSVAGQSTIGVKEALETLTKRVVKAEKAVLELATKDSVTKVDNKLVQVVKVNNLTLPGGGGRG